jgi:hypothetical protein
LFLTLLCPLKLNGLQQKALMIWDAIIIVNTLNQRTLSCRAFRLESLHHMKPAQTCQYCRHCMTHTHQLITKWCKPGMSGPAQHVQLIEFRLSRCTVCCSNLKYFPIFFFSETYSSLSVIILKTCDCKKSIFYNNIAICINRNKKL